MGPERRLEDKACKLVRARGGIALKLDPRWAAGVPDRMFILKGVVWFVEFKAPGGGGRGIGRLTPQQRRFRERLVQLEQRYLCTDDLDEFRSVLGLDAGGDDEDADADAHTCSVA